MIIRMIILIITDMMTDISSPINISNRVDIAMAQDTKINLTAFKIPDQSLVFDLRYLFISWL